MELDEFEILQGKARTCNHRVTVTSARVCTRAAEVGSSVTARGKDGLVRAETMQGAVLHVERDDTNTLAILHDQVEREVLDEEIGVVAEGLAIERVQQSVAGTVSGSSATICLTTLAVL